MNTKETIQFNGNSYTVRSVTHQVALTVTFGSHSLIEAMKSKGSFDDSEVVAVDETIYAYASDEAIENLTDKEFEEYVNKWYD